FAGYQRFYEAEPDDDRNLAFFGRFVAPSDRGLLLKAEDGDRVVGFATIYWTHSSTHAADVALMNDLYVAESHRGRRIGRRLIEAVVGAARERGCRHVEWLTAPDNRAARRLYDRTGAASSEWVAYEIVPGPAAGPAGAVEPSQASSGIGRSGSMS
ncbi:MAG: GNAT family N-acetyltransferase, partial [Actinobacteria bacterium]|nr:GNAT family N-acetyltransferase [Actinomycetota bacterium]